MTFRSTTFKTDGIKVVLVFLISNFFLTKIPREGNMFVKKNDVPNAANSALIKIIEPCRTYIL